MKRVAVLDPGRCKCGLVLADLQLGLVREGHVLAPEAVEPWLEPVSYTHLTLPTICSV